MKTKLSLGALAFLLIAAIFTVRAQQPPTEPVAGSSPLINERLKCGVSISGPKWIQVNDDDDNENGVWDWEGPPQPGGAEPTDGEKRTGVITVTATLPDTCPNAVGICVTAKGTSLQRIDGFWPGKVIITGKDGNVIREWGDDEQAKEKKVVKEQPYSFGISPGETAICHVWFEGYHHSEAGPPDVLVEARSADGTPCGLHGHLGPQIHKLSVYQVDLDVDSNNNEGFDFTGGSDEEDPIEASERPEIPGKIIAVPINPDADGDGVEDWKDGFGVAGGNLGNTRFVPMVVHLPEPYDPEQAVVEFSYKMSDPRAVAPGTQQVPVGFRIWTSDAGVLRSLDPLPASPPAPAKGFFVPAGQEIPWKLLAANCASAASGNYDGPAVIVFLETVFSWGSGTSPFQPKEKITVAAGPSYGSIHAVVVPPADPPPITTDTVHIAVACTGSLKISGPDTLVVNDNDDNKSDTWDKNDPAVPTGDPQIKVVTVEAEAGNQPLTVNILPALPGVDQIIGGYFLDGTKIGRHSLPLTIPAYQKVVANLHVEGVRNSSALEDVTITATVAGSGYSSGSNLCVVTPPDVSHKLTVYQVDLDVDSNNNEGFDFTEGSPAEDQIEASENPANPGKIIAVPLDADMDGDGVPDWKDGFGAAGGTLAPGVRFVPMIVNLPPPYNPATAVVEFAYTMSDPRSVNPGTTTPPPSGFRIWTADAMVLRSTASPAANPAGGTGCLVPAGESIPWASLAANCTPAATGTYPGQAVIVYLETIITSAAGGPAFDPQQQITVTANAAYGDAPSTSTDTVQVTVRCTGSVKITGPTTLVVNDNDDNGNDEWDKFDTPISPADPDVIPITVTATAGDEAITVTVTSDQCGTGLGNLIRGFFPDASKSTPLMETQFDVPQNTSVAKVFYVEGISNSATVDDVVITAAATGSVPYGAVQPGAYDNKAVHKLTVYQVDLDVDSNNNEGFTFTPGSVAEDEIEASINPAMPGKVLSPNILDSDYDGIPDFADGYDIAHGGAATTQQANGASHSFVPALLEVKAPLDLTTATVTFGYPVSAPGAVTRSGTGTAAAPYVYTPAGGSLRIWTLDGPSARSMSSVVSGGNFIPNATPVPVSALASCAVSGNPRLFKIFIESVKGSATIADTQITVIADPGVSATGGSTSGGGTGTGGSTGVKPSDKVNLTTVTVDEIHPLAADFPAGNPNIGRVLISTHAGDTRAGKYYTPSQTADAQVEITAKIKPVIPGVQVHFEVTDPDDQSPYEARATPGPATDPQDINPNDNLDPARTMTGGGYAAYQTACLSARSATADSGGVAKINLNFTNRYSGDNYVVRAVCRDPEGQAFDSSSGTVAINTPASPPVLNPVSGGVDPSANPAIKDTATLVAWKRIYLEYDQMYKMGGTILSTGGTPAGTTATVDNTGDFAIGQTVDVFNSAGGHETATIKDISGNVLEFNAALSGTYPMYSGVRPTLDPAGNPIANAGDVYDIPNRDMRPGYGGDTPGTDGGCFVEFVEGVLPGGGHVPKYTEFPNEGTIEGYNKNWEATGYTRDNVCHLSACNIKYLLASGGRSNGTTYIERKEINMWMGKLDATYGSNSTPKQETLTHEVGHFTGKLAGSNDTGVNYVPHVDSRASTLNHEANDGCVMTYSRKRTDGVMEFCETCIEFIRKQQSPR